MNRFELTINGLEYYADTLLTRFLYNPGPLYCLPISEKLFTESRESMIERLGTNLDSQEAIGLYYDSLMNTTTMPEQSSSKLAQERIGAIARALSQSESLLGNVRLAGLYSSVGLFEGVTNPRGKYSLLTTRQPHHRAAEYLAQTANRNPWRRPITLQSSQNNTPVLNRLCAEVGPESPPDEMMARAAIIGSRIMELAISTVEQEGRALPPAAIRYKQETGIWTFSDIQLVVDNLDWVVRPRSML